MACQLSFFFVYLVRSSVDGTSYIGYTSDLSKRISDHNRGKTKSLRSKVPVELIYFEDYRSARTARKRESYLKKTRAAKNEIIQRLMDAD